MANHSLAYSRNKYEHRNTITNINLVSARRLMDPLNANHTHQYLLQSILDKL